MKKIIIITIFIALLLVVCSPLTMAGNPPGMIVRDDGQSEDTPWGDLSAAEPISSDIESKQDDNDTEAVISDDIVSVISIFSPVTTVLIIDIIIMAELEQ